MTFDQWIDAVNVQVHARLGDAVHTEELGWDSALWVGPTGTAAAALGDDERTAKFSFDRGEHVSIAFGDAAATPEAVGATVAKHLSS
ncbi:MAG: hypothetical protein NVSMB19_12520 [Vulcanimicrobiaceae bacterium]